MKIKLNAELSGDEIIKYFLDILHQNNIKVESSKDVKILVKPKNGGEDVEITSDRLKIVLNQG